MGEESLLKTVHRLQQWPLLELLSLSSEMLHVFPSNQQPSRLWQEALLLLSRIAFCKKMLNLFILVWLTEISKLQQNSLELVLPLLELLVLELELEQCLAA